MRLAKFISMMLLISILSILAVAADQPLYLVVVASARSAAEIAEKAKNLAARAKGGLVVQTSDCGESRNVFAFITGIVTSQESARSGVQAAKAIAPDAYIKPCLVKPGSLLAARVTAVDPSIADVPKTAVNWSEADRVSAARPLPDGRSLLVEPYYVNVKDDPLEGRRERVAITDFDDGNVVLEQDCYRPGTATVTEGRIAFDCEREQAGDHLLHSVVAFDAAGRKITEVKHCRNPKWMGASILTCESESVGANGKLVLAPNRVPL